MANLPALPTPGQKPWSLNPHITAINAESTANAAEIATGRLSENQLYNKYETYAKVSAYGATGNGSTNDAPAIQAAINAVKSSPTRGGVVWLDPGTYIVNSKITIPAYVMLRGSATRATTIKAGNASAASRVIEMESFASRLEDISIDAGDFADSVCVYSQSINEFSGLRRVVLRNFRLYGLDVFNTGSLPPQTWTADEVEVYPSVAAQTGAKGIYIHGGTSPRYLRGITVNSMDNVTVLPGFVGIEVDGGGYFSIEHYHAEKVGEAARIGRNLQTGSMTFMHHNYGPSVARGLVLDGTGGNGFVAIQIKNDGSDTALEDVSASKISSGRIAFYVSAPGAAGAQSILDTTTGSRTRLPNVSIQGDVTWGGDASLSRTSANNLSLAPGDHFNIDGTWTGGRLKLGAYQLWVDTSGRLRIKNGGPTSDTDGTIVGLQA